jgi:phage protein D
MLNAFPAVPAGRAPRAIVRVTSGTGNNASAVTNASVDGWISWEVTSNTYYEADTFRVSFAMSQLPAAMDANWFSTQTQLFVEIMAGFPADPAHPTPSELVSLIYGRVDDVEINPVAAMLTLTGRDLTAVFIDAKITSLYENQRSSDIATLLAQSHGLTPVVTATAQTAGTLYKHSQVRMQADRSEWDLLTWLAREEGMVCYVTGEELHFEPDTRESSEPYLLYWQAPDSTIGSPQSNAIALSFSRSLTIAKGISVTVRSPSITKKVPVIESYPTKAKAIQAGKASPFGGVQSYSYTVAPGKTAVQCQQLAEQKYRLLVAHEMKVHADMPGDGLLTTKQILRVQGTGTAFDQNYFPTEIVRSMSLDDGYRMTVSAKNSSPDNEAT